MIGFAGNELVARYRIRVGRQIGSAALVADWLHARTDGFTTLAVVVVAGVAAGLPWVDPVIGLLIAVAILGVLRSAARQVGARLMDAVDPELVRAARDDISTWTGCLRSARYGCDGSGTPARRWRRYGARRPARTCPAACGGTLARRAVTTRSRPARPTRNSRATAQPEPARRMSSAPGENCGQTYTNAGAALTRGC